MIEVDREPNEPDAEFAAAKGYLELGPDRSYWGVARLAGVELPTIWAWAGRWRWQERAAVYDELRLAFAGRQADETRLQLSNQLDDLRADLLSAAVAAAQMVHDLIESGSGPADPELFAAVQAARLVLPVAVEAHDDGSDAQERLEKYRTALDAMSGFFYLTIPGGRPAHPSRN